MGVLGKQNDEVPGEQPVVALTCCFALWASPMLACDCGRSYARSEVRSSVRTFFVTSSFLQGPGCQSSRGLFHVAKKVRCTLNHPCTTLPVHSR